MKTTKLVLGIISIVLFVLVSFQSCAAGLGNALTGSGEVSGAAGILLSFCMLIAGIVGICTRKSKDGGIAAGIFYLSGGLLGITNYGSFADLAIWSVLCFIFGIVFILGSLRMEKTGTGNKTTETK